MHFTKKTFFQATSLVKIYYGIDLQLVDNEHFDYITFDTVVNIDILTKSYSTFLYSYRDSELYPQPQIITSLILLTDYVLKHTSSLNEASFTKTLDNYTRLDLLRLYIFCHEYLEGGNHELTLRSKQGSIHLQNCCNWFREELLSDYLNTHLQGINALSQAKEELLSGRRKRGRQPNDARILAILWGTYQMLIERQKIPDSMPNALCRFLIQLLQLQEILSADTEIDTFWIRAQLRYLRSKEEKPRFPVYN